MENVEVPSLSTDQKAKELKLLGDMSDNTQTESLIIPTDDKNNVIGSPNINCNDEVLETSNIATDNLNEVHRNDVTNINTGEVDQVDNGNIENEFMPPLENFSVIPPKNSETLGETYTADEYHSNTSQEDFSIIPHNNDNVNEDDFKTPRDPYQDDFITPREEFSMVQHPSLEETEVPQEYSSEEFNTQSKELPSEEQKSSDDTQGLAAAEEVAASATLYPEPIVVTESVPTTLETEPKPNVVPESIVPTEPVVVSESVSKTESTVPISISESELNVVRESIVTEAEVTTSDPESVIAADVSVVEARPTVKTDDEQINKDSYVSKESVVISSDKEETADTENSAAEKSATKELITHESISQQSAPNESITQKSGPIESDQNECTPSKEADPKPTVSEHVATETSVEASAPEPASGPKKTPIVEVETNASEASIAETKVLPEEVKTTIPEPSSNVVDTVSTPETTESKSPADEEDTASVGTASFDVIGPEEVKQSLEDIKELEDQTVQETPEKEGDSFDWLNVLGNDQLKKRIKKLGKGENLEKGQQVRMKYSLMLACGKEIDVDVEQTFQLGDGEVMTAIDLTCNLAKVGEVFEVVSASRFAYKEQGRPPVVPPNSSILLTIEILQSEETPKLEDMTEKERINIGDRKRKIGNDYFNCKDYDAASKNYSGACKYLDPPSYKVSGEDSQDLKDLQFKSWCNLAISELKLEKYDNGIAAANRALEIDPKSTKAMYRKGKLLAEKGRFEEAETLLKKACEIEPKSQGCKQFLKELSNTIASQKKKQQKMYKKMFNLEDDKKNTKNAENVSSSGSETTWLQGAIPMVTGAVAIGALAVAAYNGIKSVM